MGDFYKRHFFFIRRLHSLLGIIPIGAFFLVHMFLNSRAAQSPGQYQWVPNVLDEIPFIWAVELGLIIAPIVFHAILGIWIVWQSDPNSQKRSLSWYANHAYTLQRVTGVILFIMIACGAVSGFHPAVLGEQGPHPGASLVQAEILAAFQVQHHRFAIKIAE